MPAFGGGDERPTRRPSWWCARPTGAVLRIAVDLGSAPEHRAAGRGALDHEWTWPPGGPWPTAEGVRWGTEHWEPATAVRRPLVRVGRWTLVYRRPGC